MTPFSFEWQWNIEYLIFFGLLYVALAIIGFGLVYSFIKAWLNLSSEEERGAPPEISYRERYPEY
jgi:hypothetical protein